MSNHISFKGFVFNLSDVRSFKYSENGALMKFYDRKNEKIVCTEEEYKQFLNSLNVSGLLKVFV